jgi:hypothetical protein
VQRVWVSGSKFDFLFQITLNLGFISQLFNLPVFHGFNISRVRTVHYVSSVMFKNSAKIVVFYISVSC